MKKFTDSKWFYRLLALFFALLLFFNANNSANTSSSNPTPISNNNNNVYSEEVNAVPIDWQYDNQEYYVVPKSNVVDVVLTSSNKVLLNTEANSQTRQFDIVGDLRGKGPGTYEIPLKVNKLNNAISIKLKDKKIPVTISKKTTKTFRIDSDISHLQVAKGYKIDKITTNPTTVKVTGGKEDIEKIDKVVPQLSSKSTIKHDVSEKAELKAFDKEGNVLNVSFSVPVVTVSIKVSSSTKTVPINLLQKGELPSGIEGYQFVCDIQSVELSGPKDKLDNIKSINAYIDVSNIYQTETKKIVLNIPSDVQSNLKKVSVTIIPMKMGEKPVNVQSSSQ